MRREDDLLKYYDVPVESVPATYTPISPEERKRRVAELNKKVAENIERLQNSTEFRSYLIAMSHFHNYSWNNQMLIWLQKPDAGRVAGYNTWRDLGWWVKKGEQGLEILAPLGPTSAVTWYRATDNASYFIKRGQKGWDIYDHDRLIEKGFPSWAAAARRLKDMGFVEHKETLGVSNFKVVHVFDISQTEGKDLPGFDVPELTGQANQALFDDLLILAKRQNVKVNFDSMPGEDPGRKGFFRPPDFIWVRPEESPAQQLNVVLHELSHYFTEEVFRIARKDAETIAECAACVVGAYHGFDTGVRSFPYVAVWAKDPTVLHANIDSIQKAANKIITELETIQGQLLPMIDRDRTAEDWWNRARIGKSAAWTKMGVKVRPVTYDELWPTEKRIVYHYFSKGGFPSSVEYSTTEVEVKPGETVQQAAKRLESRWSLERVKEEAKRKGVSMTGSKGDICKRLLVLERGNP